MSPDAHQWPLATSRRRYALLAMVAVLPVLVLVARHWNVHPGESRGDYAQYVLHAKALVEGRPYGDVGYIFSEMSPSVGPRSYPPGLPLTIAPLVALDGTETVLLRVFMVVTLLAFLVVAGVYFGLVVSPWVGLGTAAIVGVAIEFDYATIAIGSDLAFCAMIWAIILIADRTRRWRLPQDVAVTLLGFGAISYRLAGVSIIPALALFAFLNRGKLGWRPLAPVVVWLTVGGAAAIALAIPVPMSVLQGVGEMFRRSGEIIVSYRLPLFQAELYPLPWNVANDVYHVVATGAILAGLFLLARTHLRSLLFAFAACYMAMLFVVRVAADSRYLWPLFPLYAGAMLVAGRELARRRVSAGRADRWMFATAVVLAAITAWNTIRRIDPPSFQTDPAARALFAHVRELARTDARIAFVNPRVLTLETGVPAMSMLFEERAPDMLDELERLRITHVVADLPAGSRHPLGLIGIPQLIDERPDRFALVYENGRFRLYRFLPGSS